MASEAPLHSTPPAAQPSAHSPRAGRLSAWFRNRTARRVPPLDALFEFSTLGLVLCGYLAMLSTGSLDLFTSAFVSVGLCYRAIALMGLLPVQFPGWLLGTLTVVAMLLYPLDILWWSQDFIQATVHLLFYLAVLKLISAQDIRDHVARLVLAFLVLVVAAVLSSDSLFFLFLLGFLVFSVMAFTSLELHRALRRNQPATGGSHRLLTRLTAVSTLISVGIVAMSMGLFYALPRSAKAALNQFLLQREISSGFSKEVVLGRYGELVRNPAVVMRIREIPVNGAIAPRAFPVHWRGATLTDFDGRRWSSPMQAGELIRVANNEVFLEAESQRRRPGLRAGYHVYLEPDAGEHLFFPGLPEFLRLTQPILVRYPDHSARLPNASKDAVEYAIFSFFDGEWELAEGRMAALSATDAVRPTDLLRLPSLDPRIGDLARTVTADYDNALDKARILSSYLRGNYRYRLETTAARQPDPLAHFLFESRQGHCEYFASALAVMLREIGIPSRVVTGFVASEYNPITGWHVVRMSDAHSWVEAWLPERGWFGFDPTPSSRLQPTSQVLARMRLWQDTIDTFWKDWVLAYDFNRQVSLAQMVERGGGELGNLGNGLIAGARRRGDSIRELPARYPWLLAALLLLVPLRWAWRRSRTARKARAVAAALPPASQLYLQAIRLLEKRGYHKPPFLTSEEFALHMQAFPGLAPLREFTQAYLRARYGNSPDDLNRMRALLPVLAQAPRRHSARKAAIG
jgi:transglutaminase-like putative cysteine protease